MATFEATLTDTANFNLYNSISYVSVQGAESCLSLSHNSTQIAVGQNYTEFAIQIWTIYRSGLRFSFAGLPDSAVITAAVLKLYGDADYSSADFDITLVAGDFSDPPINKDYSKGGSTSYGTLNSSACSIGSYNSLTVNAAGLDAINDARQTGEIELYIRSAEDIAISEPASNVNERYVFTGYDDSNPPVLELTYYIWGEAQYPEVIVFPDQGRIGLPTYSVIKGYLESIDTELESVTDTNGNVDLGIDFYITWTGTSEKVAWDDTNSRITITTLDNTSTLTILGDLTTVDLTIVTTGTAVDAIVTGLADLSDTAYASIKSKVTDDRVAYSAMTAPTPADDTGVIYMDSTTGNLMLKTRNDGEVGIMTDTLADWSAI